MRTRMSRARDRGGCSVFCSHRAARCHRCRRRRRRHSSFLSLLLSRTLVEDERGGGAQLYFLFLCDA